MSDKFIERKTELENCIFIKTILMVMVILYHSMIFWGGDWFTVVTPMENFWILEVIAKWLNSFHVHAFTLVSGYIYGFLRNEEGKYDQFGPFICNKIKRLILPYVFVAAVWVVPIAQYFYQYSITELLHKYILAESPNQLWFLWMLFGVFLISWLLNKALKNDIFALIVSIMALVVGIVGNRIIPNVFCIWTACDYLPLFIVGMKLREKQEWIIRRIPIWIYAVADLLLFVIWYAITGKSAGGYGKWQDEALELF